MSNFQIQGDDSDHFTEPQRGNRQIQPPETDRRQSDNQSHKNRHDTAKENPYGHRYVVLRCQNGGRIRTKTHQPGIPQRKDARAERHVNRHGKNNIDADKGENLQKISIQQIFHYGLPPFPAFAKSPSRRMNRIKMIRPKATASR